jgi:predicted nucleotidyltransferase
MNANVESLKERAKELSCLYRIHELTILEEASIDEICRAAIQVIPSGWQFPSSCWARVALQGQIYQSHGVQDTPWCVRAQIQFDGESFGRVEVFYMEEVCAALGSPFLKEERTLLQTIADRLAQLVVIRRKGVSCNSEIKQESKDHWRWRWHMTQKIAASIDPERFGVQSVYVFGSTEKGTSGLGSDIDLLIHFDGSEPQKEDLLLWLDGWSSCLRETNYLRTGYKSSNGLLDVHLITNEDIAKRHSYASKIESIHDPAYRLSLKT